MRADADRGFAWALAASIGVHAVFLISWPSSRQTISPVAATSAPVVARLAEVRFPEAPPPEVRKEQPPKPPVERSAPEKKRAAIGKVPSESSLRAPEPAQSAESAQPAGAAPAAAPSSPAAAPQTALASPTPAERPAIDANSAAQYRLQLIGAARRYAQAYPELARENNWNGNVELEIVIQADGRVELGLRRGSGHEVLDRQALDTFRRALRDVPVPASLRGRQLALEPLVVVYALKD